MRRREALGFGVFGMSLALSVGACTITTAGDSAARSDARSAGGPPVGDAGGTATGAGDARSIDGGAAPRAGLCGTAPSDDACTACLKSSCCDAFAACLGDAACVDLVQCGDACVTKYPAGKSPALTLIQCDQASCASPCSAPAQPAPSSAGPSACLPDSAVPAGAPDCVGLANTPVERDCPFGSPDPACVAAPGGSANVFCCPSGAGPTADAGPPPVVTGGSAPAYVDPQAVGLWENSNTSGVDFTNGSGSFASPSGNKAIFQFTADGQYLFEVFMQSSLYSCTMAMLGRETGTVNFHGTGFTLAPATATMTSQDSCNVSNNYEKPWQNRLDGPFEYTWTVGADPNGSGRRLLSVTYLADGSSEALLEK